MAWAALVLLQGAAAAASGPPAPDTAAPSADVATTSGTPDDAAAAAPAPPAAEATGARERRDAAQQAFLRLSDEQRYAEAADIAAQVLALTRELHGEGALELAAPLANLATMQMNLGRLGDAAGNYLAAIAVIERHEGPASPRLVNPLVGLGEVHLRGGLYAEARAAYERALLLNHAESGFYNLEQLKIMDGLSEAYLGLDRLGSANDQQRTQVQIQRRRAGGDDTQIVPALYKLGRWYNRTGQYAESRDVFQMARRILREAHGDKDPAMVDALIGEARSYLNEGAAPSSAGALKRALELLDAQPQPDPLKRAEVLVELGDLYVLSSQPRAARQRYEQAWRELTGEPSLEAQRDAYFAQASRIAGPRLPEVVGADGKDRAVVIAEGAALMQGMVLASLTVAINGDAEDTKIIESDPPGLLDDRLLRVLDATAFRPRMADGVPVVSEGVQFRHEFRYLPADSPGERGNDTPPAGERGGRIGFPEQDNAGDRDGQR